MARKPKASHPNFAMSRDRHIAFLAYQLGFTGVKFEADAVHQWKTADLDDAAPDWLAVHVECLADTTKRLAPLLSGQSSALAAGVADAARQAWEGMKAAWGRDAHRAAIAQRDASDPDLRRLEIMLRGSPLRRRRVGGPAAGDRRIHGRVAGVGGDLGEARDDGRCRTGSAGGRTPRPSYRGGAAEPSVSNAATAAVASGPAPEPVARVARNDFQLPRSFVEPALAGRSSGGSPRRLAAYARTRFAALQAACRRVCPLSRKQHMP